MDESERDEAAVLGLFLKRCLEDRAHGELRSLEEYQACFPGFEDAIASEYAQLLDEGEARDAGALPGGAGRRYRVLDEIARGGFGAVLRVWERDLRRTLAMKVLRVHDPEAGSDAGGASSPLIGRFLEEAQITGQLDHPGIVPVHELGLDSSGQIYFTMSLVRGRTLEKIIELVHRGEEGWTRARAIDVLLRVCEAVAFAHDKGVVHRDLKPANIMVGRFGETLVMDWGLARVLGREDRRDIRLRTEPDAGQSAVLSVRRELAGEATDSPLVTMEGDVVGTPAYMPPEQAQGRVEEVDPRSDVYAIGAMLYHLLAGEIPYVEKGMPTSSRVVLNWVLAGPPRPLHELQAGLPAELVAICEKAMARDPEDRYAGALELAEDLRAFLEVRVVRAYETGTFAELRKWVKRNRALSLASAAAVLALAIGLGFSLVSERRARESAREASQQAGRAEASFKMAFEAVDEMLSEVGWETLANVPQMDAVRRSLLAKALKLNERLLESRAGDAVLREEVAHSLSRMGEIQYKLGDLDEAEATTRRAIEVLQELQRERPEDPKLLSDIVGEQLNKAAYFENRGKYEDAHSILRSAISTLDALISREPGEWKHRLRKGVALQFQAIVMSHLSAPEEAAGSMREAVSLMESLAEEHPENTQFLVKLAAFRQGLGNALKALGHNEEAGAAYSQAKIEIERALEAEPENREVRFLAANILWDAGFFQHRLHRYADALQTQGESVRIARKLVEDFPGVAVYRGTLGAVLCNLGTTLDRTREVEQACARYAEAIEQERKALELAPGMLAYRRDIRIQHRLICGVLIKLGNHAEAARRAEDLAALPFDQNATRANAALYLSACSGLAARDKALVPEERARLREQHAARAMELLQLARKEGPLGLGFLRNRGFDSIRDRADFQKLLEEARAREEK